MFDFAWTEIGLIAVVAMVLIGPKDMPVAIKAVANMVKKARRMAGEFQTHVDEMVRETNLHEVRESISEIRNFDIRGEVTRAVDADGRLHAALTDDPFSPHAPASIVETSPLADGEIRLAPVDAVASAAVPDWTPAAPPLAARETAVAAPAFIPPAAARPKPARPAFIPPNAASPGA